MVLQSTKRALKEQEAQEAVEVDKNTQKCHAMADAVKYEDFDGDADVVKAQILSCVFEWITFPELVAMVHSTNTIETGMIRKMAAALFTAIDVDESGYLDLQEFRDAICDKDIIEFIKEMKQPALAEICQQRHVALCGYKKREDVIEQLFMEIALANGVIEKELGRPAVNEKEFCNFLVGLQQHRIDYYVRSVLIHNKAYCGYGMRPGKEPFRMSWMPRGWISDFIFYIRNHHPLLLLLYSDKNHPLTRAEKGMIFLCSVMVCFAGTGIVVHMDTEGAACFRDIFCFATLPSIITSNFIFFLQACPCVYHDGAKYGKIRQRIMNCFGALGNGGAAFVFLASMGCFGYALWAFLQSDTPSRYAGLVFVALGQLLTLWILIKFSVDFMPSRRLVKSFGCSFGCISFATCGTIRIGKWHIQKDKVLKSIRTKIEEVGASNLTKHPDDDTDEMEKALIKYKKKMSKPFIVPVFEGTEAKREREEEKDRRIREARFDVVAERSRAAAEKKLGKMRRVEAALESPGKEKERNHPHWYTG